MHSQERDIILDSIAEGVFTVDRYWRITSFNKAAGRFALCLPGCRPDVRRDWKKNIVSAAVAGERERGGVGIQSAQMLAERRELWIEEQKKEAEKCHGLIRKCAMAAAFVRTNVRLGRSRSMKWTRLRSTKSHVFVVESAMMFALRRQCDMTVKKFRSR
jgi:hypothetical protein